MRIRSQTKSIQAVVDGLLEEHHVVGAKATVTEAPDGWTKVSLSLSSKMNRTQQSEIASTFHGYFSGEVSTSPYINKKINANQDRTKLSYIVRLKR